MGFGKLREEFLVPKGKRIPKLLISQIKMVLHKEQSRKSSRNIMTLSIKNDTLIETIKALDNSSNC